LWRGWKHGSHFLAKRSGSGTSGRVRSQFRKFQRCTFDYNPYDHVTRGFYAYCFIDVV
jgi:hypothetical protein